MLFSANAFLYDALFRTTFLLYDALFRAMLFPNARLRSCLSKGLSFPQCAPVSPEQSSFVFVFCTMLECALPKPKGFSAAMCSLLFRRNNVICLPETVFFILPCSFLLEWLPSPGLACCNGLRSCFAMLSACDCANVATTTLQLSNQ